MLNQLLKSFMGTTGQYHFKFVSPTFFSVWYLFPHQVEIWLFYQEELEPLMVDTNHCVSLVFNQLLQLRYIHYFLIFAGYEVKARLANLQKMKGGLTCLDEIPFTHSQKKTMLIQMFCFISQVSELKLEDMADKDLKAMVFLFRQHRWLDVVSLWE